MNSFLFGSRDEAMVLSTKCLEGHGQIGNQNAKGSETSQVMIQHVHTCMWLIRAGNIWVTLTKMYITSLNLWLTRLSFSAKIMLRLERKLCFYFVAAISTKNNNMCCPLNSTRTLLHMMIQESKQSINWHRICFWKWGLTGRVSVFLFFCFQEVSWSFL